MPNPTPLPAHTLPSVRDAIGGGPFALERKSDQAFHLVPESDISGSDRHLLARYQGEIEERARQLGLNYAGSGWAYAQIACPALPDHLLLRFLRADGPGDVTEFSVAIPRELRGQVLVFPILRRSYGSFASAPRNPFTVAVFNRLLAQDKPKAKPFWLDIGFCYAALAGADFDSGYAASAGSQESGGGFQSEQMLTISGSHFLVHFITAKPRWLSWQLTFDRDGRLLSVDDAPFRGPPRFVEMKHD